MGKARDCLSTSLMQPIAQENIYRTGDAGISFLARQFPSLVYYTKLACYILKYSLIAVQGNFKDEEWVLSSKDVFKNLESVGVKIDVENLSVLSNLEGPCVFVGNHMSTFEGFCYPCIIRPFMPITFVIKEDLVKMPILKHIFKSRNPILVTRKTPRQDLKEVLQGGAERLGDGISIVIFPQTTRTNEIKAESFNSIGVKLARRAAVPVVPVAVQSEAWGCGKWIKDMGKIKPAKKIRVCFGEPLHLTGNGRKEQEETFRFIQEKLETWKSIDASS